MRVSGLVALLLLLPAPEACSSWLMENSFIVSGRTLDNAPNEWLARRGSGLLVVPRGTHGVLGLRARYGHLGFFDLPATSDASAAQEPGYRTRMAGLNEAGLSCDEQHLDESEYQTPLGDPSVDLPTHGICEWALMNFSASTEVRESLNALRIVRGNVPGGKDSGHHYTVRDAQGASIVIEVLSGTVNVYEDLNDGGKTGFGVVTNSPPFPWQLETLRFAKKKRGFARPAVGIPGAWYADERFARIYLVKSAIPTPASLSSAVAQAFTVMDTVTSPMGQQLGTDSEEGDGGDYTIWGAVYDHRDPAVYWRTARNQLVQRVRLADLALDTGAPKRFLPLDDEVLPWFHDASAALKFVPPDGAVVVDSSVLV